MNFYKLNLLNIKIIYTFAKTHRKRNKLIKNKLERENKKTLYLQRVTPKRHNERNNITQISLPTLVYYGQV